MINIEKLKTIEEAKKCNELLTKLVYSEKQYNININEQYIVNNWFENIYNKKNNVIFIAKDKEKIIGYIYCKISSIENGPTIKLEALIDGIYVEEEYRRRGIATDLITKVKEWAKENNVKYIYLNVLEQNKNAIDIYYKENFKDFEKKLRLEL